MLKPFKLDSKFEQSEWNDSDRIEATSDILDSLLHQTRDKGDDSILTRELDRCLAILKAHPFFLKKNLERILNG